MLERFGLALARHARVVLVVGGLIVVAAAVAGVGVFGRLSSGGFDDPGSASTRAADLTSQHFSAAPSLTLVVKATDGDVTSVTSRAAGRALTEQLAARPGVTVAGSYFTTPISQLLAADHRSALIQLQIAGDPGTGSAAATKVIDAYSGSQQHGALDVLAGGASGVSRDINSAVSTSLAVAESFAVPITLVLLLLVFGSVVAALLPLLIGVVAIVGTFALLDGLAHVTDVSVFAINLTTALGLGLGIDYGLLLVSRFREQLAAGDDVPTAVARTVATAGRTIAFSAGAVACALATMLVFPMYFLRSFGYAGVGGVVLAALAALILTPAALAVLGHRIDAGRLPWSAAARRPQSRFWTALARTVFRRPVIALGALAILLAAASPLLGIHFALPDQTVLAASAPSRQASDIQDAEYPGQADATMSVVLTAPADDATANGYAQVLSRVPGVTAVLSHSATVSQGRLGPPSAAATTLESSGWQRLSVVTDVPAGTAQARSIVAALRAVPVNGGPGYVIGGTDASLADTLHAIAAPLPIAAAIIVLTTFVLLFLFTGSVLQPLRALVVNALSLSAALGVVTWVFQDGHLLDLFGSTGRPMDATMTVLVLCITFGLSMDYELFLSSRITEMHRSGAPLERAVTTGLGRTGRIVSSAALLLAVSFFAFTTSSVSMLQMFGLGAGLAVVIDASLIRGILVPAAMRLLGRSNYWAPKALRRLYSRVSVSEG